MLIKYNIHLSIIGKYSYFALYLTDHSHLTIGFDGDFNIIFIYINKQDYLNIKYLDKTIDIKNGFLNKCKLDTKKIGRAHV